MAGGVSTITYAVSALPMLLKTLRSKGMNSYRLHNLHLSNVGNLVHSV